ncbi:hypothetical protein NMG60_11035946 [Bertholletia excelsa]
MASQAVDCCALEAPGMEETHEHTGEPKIAQRGDSESEAELSSGKKKKKQKQEETSRVEIDTSAPFESVKEAATRFGGIGFWKPQSHKPIVNPDPEVNLEVNDIKNMEERASQLEKDLIAKEKETLDVLKELETTKTIIEELKSMLHKEGSQEKSKDEKVNCAEKASDPGFILMELERAKMNLARTTSELAQLRATVESYTEKIEKGKISLERTRERLSSNSSRVASQGMSQNEQIKTAEIRLAAAKKMKEAARAAEAVALAEIKAISCSKGFQQNPEGFKSLPGKVDELDVSKTDILRRIEKIAEEVKANKKVLEDALNKVETQRKRRSKRDRKRHSVQNSTKFKNPSSPSHHGKNPSLLVPKGLNLNPVNHQPELIISRPTLSIGQILSRKLLLAQEFETGTGMVVEKGGVKREVSLGEMLGKPFSNTRKTKESGIKQQPAKRMKFGFAQFSVLTRGQSKKEKRTADS